MAKRKRPTSAGEVKDPHAKARQKQLERLERRLAEARDEEVRRARQLAKAQALVSEIEHGVAALRTVEHVDPVPGHGAASATSSAAAPRAYCLREKRTVVVADPVAIVLRNGRPAVSGTCPDCGVRVVSTARLTALPLTSGASASSTPHA